MDFVRERMQPVIELETDPQIKAKLNTVTNMMEVVEYHRWLDALYVAMNTKLKHETPEDVLAWMKSPETVDLFENCLTLRQNAIARGTTL